jgi:hypothetical protein
MNNASFIALTGYEVRAKKIRTRAIPSLAVVYEVTDTTGWMDLTPRFISLMEALCYAENVDRARDLSAEALAYFNASGVLVD